MDGQVAGSGVVVCTVCFGSFLYRRRVVVRRLGRHCCVVFGLALGLLSVCFVAGVIVGVVIVAVVCGGMRHCGLIGRNWSRSTAP